MSQEIAVQPRSTSLPEQIEYARVLANSQMLPAQYRGKPENLLYAVTYAEAIGVHPMTAVTGIHVIEGKPTASAALISGLVRRAGHKLRVSFDKATQTATATIIRFDDPDYEFTASWDAEKAKQAGLAGKKVWSNYPAAMLSSRAITEVARIACSEALFGIQYTPEELGSDNIDSDGNPAVAAIPGAPTVDYAMLAEQSEDLDEIREIWEKARNAFESTSVLDTIKARGLAIAETNNSNETLVVEAEIIEEEEEV